MAVTAVLSNKFKEAVALGKIDVSTDLFTVCLMRTGWAFNKDIHGWRKNIKGTITGSGNITWAAATKTATLGAGGFTAAGFVAGNKCTISGTSSNNGTKNIVTATDTILTFTESCTDESNTSAVITADDELATLYGYVQDTKQLASYSGSLDMSNDWFRALWATVIWTASGGGIGPTPGAIIYDYTDSDKTIVGYVNFGEELTTPMGVDLALTTPSLQSA